MAANPIVVVDAGRVEIPKELQQDPRFRDGARLQLVPMSQARDPLDPAAAWEAFLSLRGILKNSDYDPNAE